MMMVAGGSFYKNTPSTWGTAEEILELAKTHNYFIAYDVETTSLNPSTAKNPKNKLATTSKEMSSYVYTHTVRVGYKFHIYRTNEEIRTQLWEPLI
jgi:hypothetical protein